MIQQHACTDKCEAENNTDTKDMLQYRSICINKVYCFNVKNFLNKIYNEFWFLCEFLQEGVNTIVGNFPFMNASCT